MQEVNISARGKEITERKHLFNVLAEPITIYGSSRIFFQHIIIALPTYFWGGWGGDQGCYQPVLEEDGEETKDGGGGEDDCHPDKLYGECGERHGLLSR